MGWNSRIHVGIFRNDFWHDLSSRLSGIISKSLGGEDKEEDQHYSFLVPLMKALLEKSRDQLHVTTELPSLNLHAQPMDGPAFYDFFKQYQVRVLRAILCLD